MCPQYGFMNCIVYFNSGYGSSSFSQVQLSVPAPPAGNISLLTQIWMKTNCCIYKEVTYQYWLRFRWRLYNSKNYMDKWSWVQVTVVSGFIEHVDTTIKTQLLSLILSTHSQSSSFKELAIHCKNIWVTSTMFWSSQLHAYYVCDTLQHFNGMLPIWIKA